MDGTAAGWEQVTVNSTSIAAATSFPVDSALLVKAVEQLWRVFTRIYAQAGCQAVDAAKGAAQVQAVAKRSQGH